MTILKLLIVITGVLCSAAAICDENERRVSWKDLRARQSYIQSTRPRRIDEPLREENISDDEVREIQAISSVLYPGAIANIAGVTDGCRCEEGSSCDSQVWVLAYHEGRYRGFMLSRIDDVWMVGPVQAWWFEFNRLQERFFVTSAERTAGKQMDFKRYREELQRQYDSFPRCAE